MTHLCRRTLGDAKQVTISRIGNGHDTRTGYPFSIRNRNDELH